MPSSLFAPPFPFLVFATRPRRFSWKRKVLSPEADVVIIMDDDDGNVEADRRTHKIGLKSMAKCLWKTRSYPIVPYDGLHSSPLPLNGRNEGCDTEEYEGGEEGGEEDGEEDYEPAYMSYVCRYCGTNAVCSVMEDITGCDTVTAFCPWCLQKRSIDVADLNEVDIDLVAEGEENAMSLKKALSTMRPSGAFHMVALWHVSRAPPLSSVASGSHVRMALRSSRT